MNDSSSADYEDICIFDVCDDVLLSIFCLLSAKDFVSIHLTCHNFNQLTNYKKSTINRYWNIMSSIMCRNKIHPMYKTYPWYLFYKEWFTVRYIRQRLMPDERKVSQPLFKACEYDYLYLFQMLLNNVNNKITYTANIKTIKKKHRRRSITLQFRNATPLYLASFCGSKNIVEYLLLMENIKINNKCYPHHGVDKYKEAETPVYKKHKKIVKMLIKHPKLLINDKNRNGSTALHLACQNNQTEIVSLLMNHDKIDVLVHHLI